MGSVRITPDGAGGQKVQRAFTTSTAQLSVYVRVRFPTITSTWAIAWTIQGSGSELSLYLDGGIPAIRFESNGTATTLVSSPVAGAWYDFAIVKNGANTDIAWKLATDVAWTQTSVASSTFTPSTFTFGSYPVSETLANQPCQYGKIVVWSAVQTIAVAKAEAEAPLGSSAPTRSLRASSNVFFYNDCTSAAAIGTDGSGGGNNFTVTGSPTDQDADPQFDRQLLLTVQSAAAIFSSAGGTTVSPTFGGVAPGPTGIELMLLGLKPTNSGAAQLNLQGNAGYRRVGARVAAGGYGGASAADTGDTDLHVYTRLPSPATSGVIAAIPVTTGATNGVSWAKNLRIKSLTRGRIEALAAFGAQTAAGNLSISVWDNPRAWRTQPGDMIVVCFNSPTDINTTTQYSSIAVTQTGVTFSAFAAEVYSSGNGNDIGGFIAYGVVTAGCGKDPPVLSATATTTTNVRGPAVFIRLRAGGLSPFAQAA